MRKPRNVRHRPGTVAGDLVAPIWRRQPAAAGEASRVESQRRLVPRACAAGACPRPAAVANKHVGLPVEPAEELAEVGPNSPTDVTIRSTVRVRQKALQELHQRGLHPVEGCDSVVRSKRAFGSARVASSWPCCYEGPTITSTRSRGGTISVTTFPDLTSTTWTAVGVRTYAQLAAT